MQPSSPTLPAVGSRGSWKLHALRKGTRPPIGGPAGMGRSFPVRSGSLEDPSQAMSHLSKGRAGGRSSLEEEGPLTQRPARSMKRDLWRPQAERERPATPSVEPGSRKVTFASSNAVGLQSASYLDQPKRVVERMLAFGAGVAQPLTSIRSHLCSLVWGKRVSRGPSRGSVGRLVAKPSAAPPVPSLHVRLPEQVETVGLARGAGAEGFL